MRSSPNQTFCSCAHLGRKTRARLVWESALAFCPKLSPKSVRPSLSSNLKVKMPLSTSETTMSGCFCE